MKVEVLEDVQVEKFDPIKLEVTIESKDELMSLWLRFNESPYNIASMADQHYKFAKFEPVNDNTCDLWAILDKYISSRGYKLYTS